MKIQDDRSDRRQPGEQQHTDYRPIGIPRGNGTGCSFRDGSAGKRAVFRQVFPTLRQFLSCQAVFLRNFRPGQGIRPQQYRTVQKRNILLSHSSRKLHRRSLRNRKGEIRKRRRKLHRRSLRNRKGGNTETPPEEPEESEPSEEQPGNWFDGGVGIPDRHK